MDEIEPSLVESIL